ncbi:MAG TPA: type II toxin-antitoxin system RelE/ParE family toxin [archaeon]|nr:type II toxin-antitoxin system RelE/ParE family toxin [archaeon]
MYALDIKPELDEKLSKLVKKNRKQYEIITKKVQEILQNPQHYKNLRAPLQDWKRVHIDKHFVLAFSVNETTKTVTLEDFDHHDNIYKH